MDKQEIEKRIADQKAAVVPMRDPSTFMNIKKPVGTGKGTFVERVLFESDAFLALKGVAPQMLIYLLGQRKLVKLPNKNARICDNCDELTMTYPELAKLGITKPRATRGIDDLLAKGFMEIEHHGGACQKDKSIYSLSNKYMYWRKGIVFFERPKRIKRGFQGSIKAVK